MKPNPPSSTPSLRPRSLMSVGRRQIIVTGGAGFIGRNLIAALNERGEENIVVVDRLGGTDKWRNLVGLVFDDFVDVGAFRQRVREHGLPQTVTVFHLGASGATSPERDADFLADNNYRCSRELAEACLRSGARFIYASSAATYGSGDLGCFDSDEALPKYAPLGTYGFSKHLFDLWALRNGHLAKLTGLKFFSVYGPHEDHKGGQRSLVSKVFDQIQTEGEATLFKNPRPDAPGEEPQLDFIHVNDAVAMLLHFYDHPDLGGLYNGGTGKARSWNEVATAVFAALEKEPRIGFVDMPKSLRPEFQAFTQADITKIRATGFEHDFINLEDGVQDYVQAYLLPRTNAAALA